MPPVTPGRNTVQTVADNKGCLRFVTTDRNVSAAETTANNRSDAVGLVAAPIRLCRTLRQFDAAQLLCRDDRISGDKCCLQAR